jgi:CheY-like chemotaxis protein
MHKDVAKRIFEPFFTTKGEGKGTGLGLPTVLGIVQQSGGFIDVQSAPGRGTTFKLLFPALSGEEVAFEKQAEAKPASGLDGKKVLVIEDDGALRKVISKILSAAGCRVEAAATAEAALRHSGEDFDLLIADVFLPDALGSDVAKKLMEGHPGRKVLLTSGYTGTREIEDILSHPGTGFVEKPFSEAELLHKVCELLA